MADTAADIQAAVRAAIGRGEPFYIRGGDSKRHFLGRSCDLPELDVSRHSGVVDYQPGELVLIAQSGTSLEHIQSLLAGQGQRLPFEPPDFGGRATLGGTVACNLSGPGRPWNGACRDAVLGMEIINGRGERLRFGGRVMKNVAGYDVPRLQCGALGTLGVITEVSLKVLPLPEKETTLAYDFPAGEALELMNRRCAEPRPLTGACWYGGRLYLRLAGTAAAVDHTAGLWGGEILPADQAPWERLREYTLPFFKPHLPLWRLSLGACTVPWESAEQLLDWAGAQRFVHWPGETGDLEAYVRRGRGHARLLWGGHRDREVRSSLAAVEKHWHQRLKKSFDPGGILNPGRMYADI